MYLETDSPINLGSNGSNGGFFGNDGIWAILLFAMIFGWGNGNGFGGGFGGGYGAGLYDVNANTNRGFDNLALNNGIDALQASVTNGFANAEVARCNSTTNLLQAINGVNSNFQNCCCENRLATQDLKATVISENCADREALSNGIRDIISASTNNTRAILDKLCQQEINAKDDLIDQLRTQLNFANLQASQVAQTASIREGQIDAVNSLYNRLDTCPVGTTPVYGRVPIFTCNGGCGCQNVQ